MREYMRRHASEGWIIDLTPEGQTPDVPTRIFPQVRQPLAIGLFIRKPETSADVPAMIHYRTVHGRQAQKFAELHEISIDGPGWRDTRTTWTAPFTPAADTDWDDFPALGELMPWTSPGVTGNRRWPYAPSTTILRTRVSQLQSEPDEQRRAVLMKETTSRSLKASPDPLPGFGEGQKLTPLSRDRGPLTSPVRIGYRAFDRQWIIPDNRVLDRPRSDLWTARVAGQVFVIEQHSNPIKDGPGLLFSSFIPDLDHFNGRGGRSLPLLHPDGTPNFAPGLLHSLAAVLGEPVTAESLLAYMAATVAHPGYTQTFADELTTPGVRVPITSDRNLFAEAVAIGQDVLWAQTYGESCSDPARRPHTVRYPAGDGRQPLALTPIITMPAEIAYDLERFTVVLGNGQFGPVRPEVWDYEVGGKNVIKSWVNYRKAEPGGKKTSPLDHLHVEAWDADWTTEFIDLLTVLTRLVELEPAQSDLLARILDAPLLTMESLRESGVRWPSKPADRRPRSSVHSVSKGRQDTLTYNPS